LARVVASGGLTDLRVLPGEKKSCGAQPRERAPASYGVSRADFFWGGRGLNYFPEIKEIKGLSAKRSRASRVFSRSWVWCLGLSPRQIAAGRAFIFQSRCMGVGVVKSLGSSSGDRAAPPHAFPQNSENFFTPCSTRTWQPRERDALQETSRNSGWGVARVAT
jgi:hypothetical protein